MEISLPYGGRLIKFDIPNLAGRFRCSFPQVLNTEQIKIRIDEGLRPFRHTLTTSKVLTVVNDATRRTPTDSILEYIWDYVKSGDFIVATGTHRQPTSQELSTIFGKWLPHIEPRLARHDCYDSSLMIELGNTKYGTPVKLNKALFNADVILTINSVEPHFFAGFTGGRKSIIPGLASFETIQKNHCLAKDVKAVSLNLETNPLHEDLEDGLALLKNKTIITVQCVTDRDGAIIDIHSGELKEAFHKACKTSEQYYTVATPQKYDIVIANCEPPLAASKSPGSGRQYRKTGRHTDSSRCL
jgi:nickel-dependent lactate racemase